MPLWHAAFYSEYQMAESLFAAGADVNPAVYASGSPMDQAYGADDEKMKVLLRRHGAFTSVETVGYYRDTEAAREILEGKTTTYSHPDPVRDGSPAEKMLLAAACGGDPEIVAMCITRINRSPEDPWWAEILLQPMRTWNHGYHRRHSGFDRSTYTKCLHLLLQHGVDPDVTDQRGFTALHDLAHGSCSGTWNMTEEEELEFGRLLLDAGADLTVRDPLLKSTPLSWACRNGRLELAKLMIERGAAVNEPDAEPWATPLAWATKMGHQEIAVLLREHGAET
jgi:ankyrin repeat protein